MKGISYVTDEKGKKIAVQISLLDYKNIEDLLDGIVTESRRKGKTHSLDKFRKELINEIRKSEKSRKIKWSAAKKQIASWK